MYNQLLRLTNDEVSIALSTGVTVRLCVCAGVLPPHTFIFLDVSLFDTFHASQHIINYQIAPPHDYWFACVPIWMRAHGHADIYTVCTHTHAHYRDMVSDQHV